MANILITGATGFIGSHLIERLSENATDTLIGVDNFDSYYTTQKYTNLELLKQLPNFVFIEGDILDTALMERVFSHYSPSTVIHLAARPGVRSSFESASAHETINTNATKHIALIAKKYGVKQFIFSSSSSVYGNRPGDIRPCKEADDLNPISPYAVSKRKAEIALIEIFKNTPVALSILRLFSVYGERMRPDLAPTIFASAIIHNEPLNRFGSGEALRDYTYVGDVVQGVICVMKAATPGAKIYNIGNGSAVSVNHMLHTIERLIGVKALVQTAPAHTGDAAYTFADISRAHAIGYRPSVEFEEGMARFIDWYMQNSQQFPSRYSRQSISNRA